MRLGLLIALLLSFVVVDSSDGRGRWRRRRNNNYVTYSSPSYSFTGNAQAVAEQKANLQASRGYMFHPGGSFGGGTHEGVGAGMTAAQALVSCCFSNSGMTIVGQAVVRSSNGMYYACRIYR